MDSLFSMYLDTNLKESVFAPLSLNEDLERDEVILSNLRKMIEEAPNSEMKRIWTIHYNTFLRNIERKVLDAL